MSGKPITTDLIPATPAPDAAASAGILADLRPAAAGPEAGVEASPTLGELSSLTARRTRRLSMQTLVVAVVIAASAAALYLMRKQGIQAGMRLKTNPTMANEIEKVTGPATSSGAEQRILADLVRASMSASDDFAHLEKNPFVLDAPVAEKLGPAVPDANAERQAQIRDRFANIRLNGVMEGPVPLARVNDRLVKVGDIVEDFFLVAQIHDRSVDLIADGRTYSLNMGENAVAPAPGGGRRPSRPPTPSPSPAPTPPRH